MRYSKSARLTRTLVCTAYELSVGDVLSLAFLLADFEYPQQAKEFFNQHGDNLMHRAREVIVFNTGDFEKNIVQHKTAVYACFVDANPALFSKSTEQSTDDFGIVETIKGFDYHNDLAQGVHALVRLGHSHALTYPLSFYNTLIETIVNG